VVEKAAENIVVGLAVVVEKVAAEDTVVEKVAENIVAVVVEKVDWVVALDTPLAEG
jgi:hypothetical protein